MRYRWPKETVFRRVVLDVEQGRCAGCGRRLHICDHRRRRFFTLDGPVELCCRLAHCSDPACPVRSSTLAPAAEASLSLPWWLIGWDVFCWLGHRRFARHWSVPQIRQELLDRFGIPLSHDAIADYLRRYQTILAARQQDLARLRLAYRDIDALWLSIDGLQPEKGHETLYVVRELRTGRVWFAEALLSSAEAEVRRLLLRAKELARELDKPVRLWLSDKQDAFLKAIALEFEGVPHRYCSNHFLREIAKPALELDSKAKVKMRKKVRGLREIEREVLLARRQDHAQVAKPQAIKSNTPLTGTVPDNAADSQPGRKVAGPMARASEGANAVSPEKADQAGQVVLDYCACVRGILNDDQGGPLHPPGLRMAEALAEVRASLARNLALAKPGPAHGRLERLAGCIDRGLEEVKERQEQVREQVKEIKEIARTLEEASGTLGARRKIYQRLRREYEKSGGANDHLAKVMKSWARGLFVHVRCGKNNSPPQDNLDLERWFRLPKRHERKIHGRSHAGVRIVLECPTLLLALDAHEEHPEPFTAHDLLPYRLAAEPDHQLHARSRHSVMRMARSKKNEKPFSRS